MENHIQADRIANSIMMDNSFKGYYLIVEGNKDYYLFSKFINSSNVLIKEAFGYEKVKLVLQILSERGFSNCLGIIDSDFSKILKIEHKEKALFITDCHDIEVMIFKTQALDNILRIYVTPSKVKNFEKTKGKNIRQIIFGLSVHLGLLKLANKVHGLGLIFKPKEVDGNQIRYNDFIDEKTMVFKGIQPMIASLINYTRSKTNGLKSEEEITQQLREISKQQYQLDHLVNGHDLSNILWLLLKKTLSSTSKMLYDFNSIENSLILAYDYEEFKKTELYKNIEIFEQANNTKIWR